VIDVARIKELIGVDASADTLTIKAATTHYDVAQSVGGEGTSPDRQNDRSPQTCWDLLEIPTLLRDLEIDDAWRGRRTHLYRR
jgi:hypothetical protein